MTDIEARYLVAMGKAMHYCMEVNYYECHVDVSYTDMSLSQAHTRLSDWGAGKVSTKTKMEHTCKAINAILPVAIAVAFRDSKDHLNDALVVLNGGAA